MSKLTKPKTTGILHKDDLLSEYLDDKFIGISRGNVDTIGSYLNYGSFKVSKDATFVAEGGLIPGGYDRVDRSFSEGYRYEYGALKMQKYCFGIFEDACVLAAIAGGRNKENATQILGAGTGADVARYNNIDTAATFFENVAQPAYFRSDTAVFTQTTASGLSVPEKMRYNMVAMVVNGDRRWYGLIKSWTQDSITVDGWYEAKTAKESIPSGTLLVQPQLRVWASNMLVDIPPNSDAESAVGLETMVTLQKRGIGANTQIYKAINNNVIGERAESAYESVGLFTTGYRATQGCVEGFKSEASSNSGFISVQDQIGLRVLNPVVNAFQIDNADHTNLFIDAGGSIMQQSRKAAGSVVASFGPNPAAGLTVYARGGGGANGAGTVVTVGKDEETGRSVNAGGTINASGADYAEYMVKSQGCPIIKKGDICGVNRYGELTTVFDDAISFVIKSTNPCMVGGDIYEDLTNVDRIAFCGRVPVNTYGNPGDYIVPVRNTDGTIGSFATPSPSFEQYRIAVGQVWSNLKGETIVSVKVG